MNKEMHKLGDTVYYWDENGVREGIIYLRHSNYAYVMTTDEFPINCTDVKWEDLYMNSGSVLGRRPCVSIPDSAEETEVRKLPGLGDDVYFISHEFIRGGIYQGRSIHKDAYISAHDESCISGHDESENRSVPFEDIFCTHLDAENELARRKKSSEMDFTTEAEEKEEKEENQVFHPGDVFYTIRSGSVRVAVVLEVRHGGLTIEVSTINSKEITERHHVRPASLYSLACDAQEALDEINAEKEKEKKEFKVGDEVYYYDDDDDDGNDKFGFGKITAIRGRWFILTKKDGCSHCQIHTWSVGKTLEEAKVEANRVSREEIDEFYEIYKANNDFD